MSAVHLAGRQPSRLGRLLAPTKAGETARGRRRAYPVHFYTGRNGAGKSLAAVYDTLPDLDRGARDGRRVLSTVRLTDFRDPRPCPLDRDECDDPRGHDVGHLAAHPAYEPFTTWPQLLSFTGRAVLMDEITGVADSNEGASLPASVGNMLAQMRRADFAVRITGLNFIRANKRLREAVTAVTRCKSYMPVTVQRADGADRVWRPRRLAVWQTFDADSLPIDDHTSAAYEKADHIVTARHWIPDSPCVTAYDTFSPVLVVGTVTDSGRCAYCAGTRRPHECSCEDYVSEKAARRSGGPQARSAEDRTGRRLPLRDVSAGL